jgi:hypothetical protein
MNDAFEQLRAANHVTLCDPPAIEDLWRRLDAGDTTGETGSRADRTVAPERRSGALARRRRSHPRGAWPGGLRSTSRTTEASAGKPQAARNCDGAAWSASPAGNERRQDRHIRDELRRASSLRVGQTAPALCNDDAVGNRDLHRCAANRWDESGLRWRPGTVGSLQPRPFRG